MGEPANISNQQEGLRILARLIALRLMKTHPGRFGRLDEQGLLPNDGQEGKDESPLPYEDIAE